MQMSSLVNLVQLQIKVNFKGSRGHIKNFQSSSRCGRGDRTNHIYPYLDKLSSQQRFLDKENVKEVLLEPAPILEITFIFFLQTFKIINK